MLHTTILQADSLDQPTSIETTTTAYKTRKKHRLQNDLWNVIYISNLGFKFYYNGNNCTLIFTNHPLSCGCRHWRCCRCRCQHCGQTLTSNSVPGYPGTKLAILWGGGGGFLGFFMLKFFGGFKKNSQLMCTELSEEG